MAAKTSAPLWIPLALGGLTLAGCAADARLPFTSGGQRLSPDDFRAVNTPALEPEQPRVIADTPAGQPPAPVAPPPPTAPTPTDAGASAQRPIASVGAPRLSPVEPDPAGDPRVVDAMIGQINGVPVFVNDVLTELDGVLRNIASESPNERAWMEGAAREIATQLLQRTRDDLLLAEAKSKIPHENQEAGFRNFLDAFRRTMTLEAGGSEAAAESAVLSNEGRTLQEKAQDALEVRLIAQELNREAYSRVSVSGRDIEIAYQQNYASFNPPGVAFIYLVGVKADDQEGADRIGAALASGTPIDEVARSDDNTSGLKSPLERRLTGPTEDATLLEAPELNEAAQSVPIGQTAGPVRVQDRLYWVQVASVERPAGRTLYEAQTELGSGLESRRRDAARLKYFERLLGRGSYDNLDSMTTSILQIATARYYEPSRRARNATGSTPSGTPQP